MNAETGESAPQPFEPSSPGAALRTARERRQLSLQEAADDLHLDARVVEALEADRYATLGAPVYARGHLRKYAALVGLNPDEVLRAYERLTDIPETPTHIPVSTAAPLRIRERHSARGPLLIVSALAALGLGAWLLMWLLSSRTMNVPTSAAPSPTVAGAEAPRADAPLTTQSAPPESAPPESATPETAAAAPSVTPSATPEPSTSVSALLPGQVRLRLEFSGESWAEVYDGAGKRLMFGIGAPGRTRELSGPAPLHVTLGAASAVTAAVNGEQVAIPRRAGRDAARFSIDENGSVQPTGPRRASGEEIE